MWWILHFFLSHIKGSINILSQYLISFTVELTQQIFQFFVLIVDKLLLHFFVLDIFCQWLHPLKKSAPFKRRSFGVVIAVVPAPNFPYFWQGKRMSLCFFNWALFFDAHYKFNMHNNFLKLFQRYFCAINHFICRTFVA